MPSPIAHSVSGYAIANFPFLKSRTFPNQRWPALSLVTLYAVFVSSIPDLDFLPQIVTGIRFHRGPSHSFLAALLVSAFLSWLAYRYLKFKKQPSDYLAVFALTLAIYSSHLLLDLLTYGGNGLLLLWPLSTRFQLPFALFPSVHHSRGLWDASHLTFIAAELIYSAFLFTGLKRLNANSPEKDLPKRSQNS